MAAGQRLGFRGLFAGAIARAAPPHLPPGEFPAPPGLGDLAKLEPGQIEKLAAWFAVWDAPLAELRAAAQRPFAQLPGNYSSPELVPIPDFVAARSLAQAVAVRARVHLLLGRGEAAIEDLDALSAVMRGMDGTPSILVTSMIRCAIGGLYLDVVEEGFSRGLWSSQTLPGLQQRLGAADFLNGFVASVRDGERAGMCYLLEKLATARAREARQSLLQAITGGSGWEARLISLMPAGFIRRNQLLGAQLLQQSLAVIDPVERRYYPARAEEAKAAIDEAFARRRPGNMLAAMFIPNLGKASTTVARIQTRYILAAIYCALVRHRLERGNFPERLDLLAPEFMQSVPRDLVTGAAPIYRRVDSRCELYGVGPNGRDDGGAGDDWTWMQEPSK